VVQVTDVVHVNLSRTDLARMSISVSMRHSSTIIGWIVIAALVAVTLVVTEGLPRSERAWGAFGLAVLGGSTAAMIVGVVISLVFIVTSSSEKNGVLGRHTYAVTADGLLEKTAANETLIKWGGARELRRNNDAIYIGVAPALFHVIPRRAFGSGVEYDAFWAAIQRLHDSDAR
jgi:hypothetical protein